MRRRLHARCTASAATTLVRGVRPRRVRRAGRRRRAAAARRHVPDGVVPEPGGAGGDGSVARPWPPTSAPTSRSRNDPDADRLGAAIPQPDGSWRRLSGDEIGWLLADHILRHTTGDDRLVITTLVSSSLLATDGRGRTASHFAETFTGFKWIGQTVLDQPESALRVRLRAGARLPRDATVRSTRTASRAAVLLAEVAGARRAPRA